jgi:hypothetical protein
LPELLLTMLQADLNDEPEGGISVGPATADEHLAGCIVINDMGMPHPELDTPLARKNFMVRCIAGSQAEAERLSVLVEEAFENMGRRIVRQESAKASYLVHNAWVIGGPTLAPGETNGTVEERLQIQMLVGTQEVSSDDET